MQNGTYLGGGGFGVVTTVTYKDALYACKGIRLKYATPPDLKGVAKEMTFGSMLDHHNILPTASWVVELQAVYLFMPLATHDLESYLKEHTLNEEKAAKKLPLPGAHLIMMQVLDGIIYLHECRVVHGDVKPNNVLITQNPVTEEKHVRICDFGLSNFQGEKPEHTHMGSPWYTDPNVVQAISEKKQPTSEFAHDIYSLAVLIIQLFGGWESVELWFFHRLLAADMSPEMHDMILSMLDIDEPQNRPSAAKVRKDLGGPTEKHTSQKIPTQTQLTETYQKFLEEVSQTIEPECIYMHWLTNRRRTAPVTSEQ
jgi:serine/threonine protein kinase